MMINWSEFRTCAYVFTLVYVNTQKSSLDRFIKSRWSLNNLRMKLSLNDKYQCKHSVLDHIESTKDLKQRNYVNHLDKEFDLADIKCKSQIELQLGSNKKSKGPSRPWPCVARKQKYFHSADSVLELPRSEYDSFTDLLDWGQHDILIAALDMKYYNWSWKTQDLVKVGLTEHEVRNCKYEPSKGNIIAFGTSDGMEIHDGDRCQCLVARPCPCTLSCSQPGQVCHNTSLAWSPTGKSFVTGCDLGMLVAWSHQGLAIKWKRVQCSGIFYTAISPDARHVAWLRLELTSTVMIAKWPTLEPAYRLPIQGIAKNLSWHPWRSSLLCVGFSVPSFCSTLILWNIPRMEVYSYNISNSLCQIEGSIFNRTTGELVLNIVTDVSGNICTRLMVLSDPETIVDIWKQPNYCDINRVQQMVFSPNGTKLATVTADDDLLIWNFLPDTKQNRIRKNDFAAMPVYLDEFNGSMSLR